MHKFCSAYGISGAAVLRAVRQGEAAVNAPTRFNVIYTIRQLPEQQRQFV